LWLTSAPTASHASLMRMSSVATTSRVSLEAFLACKYVRTIMGFPAIITRGLPGKRVEAKRAGITPSCSWEADSGGEGGREGTARVRFKPLSLLHCIPGPPADCSVLLRRSVGTERVRLDGMGGGRFDGSWVGIVLVTTAGG